MASPRAISLGCRGRVNLFTFYGSATSIVGMIFKIFKLPERPVFFSYLSLLNLEALAFP
jgi:hypothetical protein